MGNNIKVSVIIPVYNTSMYLDKCLTSLINQSLKEIEIICVNDGSTDNSLEILKNFSNKDNRIRIINQENQGQSVARNVGIKEANGQYVGFIDSDDWADEKMFERLYDKAKCLGSDVSMCSVKVFDEKTGESTTNDPYMTLSLFPKVFADKTFNYKDCLDFLFRICVTPWNKIYKKSWIQENKIKFQEGINFEDMIFSVETLIKADKISLVNEPLVVYRKASQTSYSVGNYSQDYKKMDFFTVFDLIEKFLKENSVYALFEDYFLFYKRNHLIYWYKKIENKKVKKQYYKKLVSIYPDFKFNNLVLFFKKRNLKKKIKNLAKDNKLVVWGSADLVRSVLPKAQKNILGFVDDNVEKQGKTIDNYKVYSPQDLKELSPDYILAITQTYYKFSKLIQIKLEDEKLNFDIVDLTL